MLHCFENCIYIYLFVYKKMQFYDRLFENSLLETRLMRLRSHHFRLNFSTRPDVLNHIQEHCMKLSLDETVVCGQGCKTHACKAVSLKPPLFSIELTECTSTPLFLNPKSNSPVYNTHRMMCRISVPILQYVNTFIVNKPLTYLLNNFNVSGVNKFVSDRRLLLSFPFSMFYSQFHEESLKFLR